MISRLLKNALDLLFSSRPILLIPVWSFSILGFAAAKNSTSQVFSLVDNLHTNEIIQLLFFSMSVSAVYIFNQIADIEVDKYNGGKPLIASGTISVKNSLWFAGILCLISISIPCAMKQHGISIYSIGAIMTGLLYSFKPSYFSGKPFADFLTNAFGYGILAFGAGWTIGGEALSKNFCFSAAPYFFLMCAGSISSTLPDIKGDALIEKKTTAVVFGAKKANVLAAMFIIIAGASSLYVNDYLALICSLLSFPLYVAYAIKPSTITMESIYKVGGSILIIASGLLFPMLLVASTVVFLCTWLYFRIRHRVSYPSLTPCK